MNAEEISNDHELAVYHLAQAETYDRMATRERLIAVKHLAAAQVKFKEALQIAKSKRNKS